MRPMYMENVRILRKFIHNVRCKWEKGRRRLALGVQEKRVKFL
jgi:hypothetical protein